MKKINICVLFIFCFLYVLVLPVQANADIGPKDSLTVYVANAPDEKYYLDLLTQDSVSYNNFNNEGGREAFN